MGMAKMPTTTVEKTKPTAEAGPIAPAKARGNDDREIRIIRQNALSHCLGSPWFATDCIGLTDDQVLERGFKIADKIVDWVTR